MFHGLGSTILPIFSVILLGYLLKAKRVIPPSFARPANQIVYYVAIPAMFLNTFSKAPFRTDFHLGGVLCLLGALVAASVGGLGVMKLLKIKSERQGTFLQSCFHGNIGYLSYAVAYYALGEGHFAQTAILSSFLIVGQNLLAVWTLTAFNPEASCKRRQWILLKTILQNPIIVTVVTGVVWSFLSLPVPRPARQFLEMLSGMAFPMALILIGASLSFGAFRWMQKEILGIALLKLAVMPLFGYILLTAWHIPQASILPGVILLASPPATVTYVMANELGGDPELAATSVSVLTLVSAVSYILLLSSLGGA